MKTASKGFTLIELLAVVAIFAIISTMVIGNLRSDPHRLLENTAKRFVNQFQLMSEEAALLGWEFGLHVDETGYSYHLWDQLQWKEIPIPEYSKSINLPEILTVELELSDDLSLNKIFIDESETINDEDKVIPQVAIFSSGEITPFLITFQTIDSESKVSVNVDLQGEVEVLYENNLS